MKNLSILLVAILGTIFSFAQDTTPIVVNISDVNFGGQILKRKATVIDFRTNINGAKEIYIKVRISLYQNNAGAYGSKIIDLVAADQLLATPTLSKNQADQINQIYGDRYFEHTTQGVCVDQTSGAVVSCFQADGVTPTVNSISEAGYWQSFSLTSTGVSSLSTGALNANYKTQSAMVTKLDAFKNW